MARGGLFMINITAITTQHQLLKNIPIERVEQPDIAWYWVDFYGPEETETALLRDFFIFIRLRLKIAFSICSARSLTITMAIAFTCFMR